jgi:predicted RNA-binding protein (virulence factor B family)
VIPEVQVGKYGWVDVVEVKENLGVFVNIGIQKDILVSEDDLPAFTTLWPTTVDRLYVALSYDQRGRLIAKPATEDVIQSIANAAPPSLRNQSISGIVYRLLKVGSFVISKEGYRCFIHESERIEEPRLGAEIEGRVIEVKEDGSLNMSLLPRKQERIDDDAEVILEYMETRGGGMPFGDKSDANDINMDFQMSKSAFKRALGKLIKENKVYQDNGWTYLQKHATKHDE